jgi:predicted ABC-type ATPase
LPAKPPIIYLIAGCNGAGKTTFATSFLPHEAKCLNFLNADLIAQGLSPLDARAAALKAGRLLLAEFRAFVARHEPFAFESTLSGLTYVRRRFGRSLRHFVHTYSLLADRWAVWDNQTSPPRLLAESRTCATPRLGAMLEVP